MNCPLCKGKMVLGKTNLPYDVGPDRVVVLKDVPALVCEQCGDSFVKMKVAQKAEKLISKAKSDGMTLGFMSYQQAA